MKITLHSKKTETISVGLPVGLGCLHYPDLDKIQWKTGQLDKALGKIFKKDI